jgi:hypothetical protein
VFCCLARFIEQRRAGDEALVTALGHHERGRYWRGALEPVETRLDRRVLPFRDASTGRKPDPQRGT